MDTRLTRGVKSDTRLTRGFNVFNRSSYELDSLALARLLHTSREHLLASAFLRRKYDNDDTEEGMPCNGLLCHALS